MKKAKNDGGLGVQKPTVDQIDTRLSTAEKLATEHHVSPATVKLAEDSAHHKMRSKLSLSHATDTGIPVSLMLCKIGYFGYFGFIRRSWQNWQAAQKTGFTRPTMKTVGRRRKLRPISLRSNAQCH